MLDLDAVSQRIYDITISDTFLFWTDDSAPQFLRFGSLNYTVPLFVWGLKPFNILFTFFRLFQTEPDLKRLFPKIVQMNEKNELEWEVDRDMLQVRNRITINVRVWKCKNKTDEIACLKMFPFATKRGSSSKVGVHVLDIIE